MKRFRRNRRAGNKPMTSAERSIVMDAKEAKCIPCLVWAEKGNMPFEHVATCSDWDHSKSGNVRRGHKDGFASCLWHHRGRVSDGWSHERTRRYFGPSLMDGSRLFHEAYGSDDYLISRQRQLLGLEAA